MKHFVNLSILILQLANCYAAPSDNTALQEQEVEGRKHPELNESVIDDMIIEDLYIRNGIIAKSKRWPNATVFYKIDDIFASDVVSHIQSVFEEFHKISCVRFYPATENMTAYVNITGEPTGCHSHVGYLARVQNLNLANNKVNKGCLKYPTMKHELLHTLGFFHEQIGAKRDEYVEILWENIKEGSEHLFYKHLTNDFGFPYDYASIMHYGAYAFSKNGNKTIVTLGGQEIGIRIDFSPIDIGKLNAMYNCFDSETTSTTTPASFTTAILPWLQHHKRNK